MVAAGGEVIHKVAEEIMELQKNRRLVFRDGCRENQEGSGSAAHSAPGPCHPWAEPEAEPEEIQAHTQPHLDLVLLSGILYRLEDAPSALPPHLQASRVAPVPSLDQGCRLEGCDTDGEASL